MSAVSVAVSLRLRPEIAEVDDPAHAASHVAPPFPPADIEIGPGIASYKGAQHRFSHTFGRDASTADIFETHRDAVLSVLSGFDTTLMAYGATGSGKTFTMLGTEEQRGLMPLAIDSLFERISNSGAGQTYALQVSALEVLEERCFDLLHAHSPVTLKSATKDGGLKFDGLQEVAVQTRDELIERICDAIAERTTAAK